MKIAIYSPNWVGDAALSLPFIYHVKQKYPNSELIIICKEWVHSVYQNNPNINKLVTYGSHDVATKFKDSDKLYDVINLYFKEDKVIEQSYLDSLFT